METSRPIIGLSIENYSDFIKSQKKSSEISQKHMVPNSSCQNIPKYKPNEGVTLSSNELLGKTSRKSELNYNEWNEDFSAPFQTPRTLAAIKSTTHAVSTRYQSIPQVRYNTNILMKSVALTKKFDRDPLLFEDKVKFIDEFRIYNEFFICKMQK